MSIRNKPRAVRGGSWHYDQDIARASFRDFNSPDIRSSLVGFRVILRETYGHRN